MTSQFGVAAITGGNPGPRPGDDFLLQFRLEEFSKNNKAAADDGSFVAVYDKKLLWRANLYVDETLHETTGNLIPGTTDWNNDNRWDDNNNTWNGNNGNQITILPWTRYNYAANTPIYNAVAYSHACYDSPVDFNTDLLAQQDAVRAWYSNNNPFWSLDNNNPHPEWGFGGAQEWNTTLAPGNVWGMTEDNGLISYRFGTQLNDGAGTYNPISYPIDNTIHTYYPYTPNFTSKKKNQVPGEYKPIHISYSSGIDCVTIIQRSAGYNGNRYYEITNLEEARQEWGDPWASLESVSSLENASWEYPLSGPLETTNLLIPGDILIIHGMTNDIPWEHCAIVQSIQYDNERNVEPVNVKLLDSSGLNMEVRLELYWDDMRNLSDVVSWSIGRLKHQ